MLSIFSLGSWVYFKKAYIRLNEGVQPTEKVEWGVDELQELIFERVPSLLPKTAIVDKHGQILFTIEPSKGNPTRWLTFFDVFQKGLFFSIHYDIVDREGRPLAHILIKNNFKQAKLILRSPSGAVIGTYIEEFKKSALKNRGILYKADGTLWRELKAKNMSGDIDVLDDSSRLTAKYRFGIFPYPMHPAFQSQTHHEYVKLGSHISHEEKLAYTMIFFFWLK